MIHRLKERHMRHALPVQTTANACHHYWVIDSAGGPTSHGRCKFCGFEKDFFNSMDAEVASRDILKLPKLGDVQIDGEEDSAE